MTDTGGPAFPGQEKQGNGSHYHSHLGMDLRDYFAAQALPIVMEFHGLGVDRMRGLIARDAYAIADAMLEWRAK